MTALQRKRRRSALEAYDGCPYRYDQLYNQGTEDRGDESQRGIAFHEVVFRYIALLVTAGLTADAGLARQALIQGIALTQLPAHLVDEVSKLWARFSEWFELDLDAYLSAESIEETDRFTWVPDLVYVRPQGVEIIDWKTFYKGLTETQARKEFQLKFYLVMALDAWPNFPAYTFTFNFVRLGYQVSVTMTPDQIERLRPEVEAILVSLQAAEETQSWPAIPGSHCTLCRLACPIVDNPRRLPVRFTTKDDALAAAGDILVLEQRVKVLKKSLAGWCNQEGPLVVNGQLFSHTSAASVNYSAADAVELLRKSYGTDIIDHGHQLRVSGSAVKAADPLKTVQADPKLLAGGRTTTRWTFRHKKAGELDLPDDDEQDEERG